MTMKDHAARYFALTYGIEYLAPGQRPRKAFKDRLSEAIAWGSPCQESTGMSHDSLCSLLAECRDRIQDLESQLASKH